MGGALSDVVARIPRRRDVANASSYREDAALLRRRVQNAQDSANGQHLLRIAEQYEQIADALDRPWLR